MIDDNAKTTVWFFGRGASVASGLSYTVPTAYNKLSRDEQERRIKKDVQIEMAKIPCGQGAYRNLLGLLEKRAPLNHRQFFVTTNWDYLLQHEIRYLEKNKILTLDWLRFETHVFHLNGSVEEVQNDEKTRSNFILETDPVAMKRKSLEGNIAMNHFIFGKAFVLVGVSFSCEADKSLLSFWRYHSEDLPFGEAKWIIVNPTEPHLMQVCSDLKRYLPRIKIVPVDRSFEKWIEDGMPEFFN